MTGISVQPEQHVALDLDAFIEAHYARLLGLLTLKTGSREEAEDLAQEAMLKLVRSWPEVSQMEHPWGWLATVAVNSSTSSWRRVFRGRAVAARLARADHHLDETGTVEMLAVIRDLPHRQRTAAASPLRTAERS
ncbi:MAG: sigma factor [Acidimicrobiales bacterium]